MNESMRTMKEEFVSNLKGTSATECVCVLVVCLLLETAMNVWSVICYQLGWGYQGRVKRIVLTVVGLVVILTIASNWVVILCVCSVSLVVLGAINSIILSKGTKYNLEVRTTIHRPQEGFTTGFLYVSKLRGCVLLTAAITILAVDFNIFPRKWAKTETYGTGLMDLGVGTFALLTGLVWPRHISRPKIFKRVGALVLLGTIRLATIKLLGYNEHVTEYGRHWNFFYTLAVVVLAGRFLSYVSSSLSRAAISVLVLGIIQHVLLVTCQYEQVCVENKIERDSSLLIANKEGLISVVGYILLWLIGRLLSYVMKTKASVWCTCLMVWSAMTYIMVDYEYMRVSRRSANLAYVLWTSGCVALCLVLTFLMDVVVNILQDRANFVSDLDCPDIFSIINRRAMFHFLFTNVLTGIINFSVDPFNLSALHSLLILLAYTFVPIVFIICLDNFGGTHWSKEA